MFQQCLHYDCNNRNNAGFCNTTMCINPRYSKIGSAQYGQGVQKQIVSNADRIRAMTDEELTKWVSDIGIDCAYCKIETLCYKLCKCFGDCEKAWGEWLKQEADK